MNIIFLKLLESFKIPNNYQLTIPTRMTVCFFISLMAKIYVNAQLFWGLVSLESTSFQFSRSEKIRLNAVIMIKYSNAITSVAIGIIIIFRVRSYSCPPFSQLAFPHKYLKFLNQIIKLFAKHVPAT